jgi:hypothetical protein
VVLQCTHIAVMSLTGFIKIDIIWEEVAHVTTTSTDKVLTTKKDRQQEASSTKTCTEELMYLSCKLKVN